VLANDSLPYNDDYSNTDKVMAFDVTDDAFDPTNNSVPAELRPENEMMTLPVPKNVKVREFRTERQGGEWTVNGYTWHDVIDSDYQLVLATPIVGDTEVWEFRNSSGGWSHPMHVHGQDSRLLTRNGKAPYAYERGPKDTYYVGENETVRILIKFDRAGKYMIHCHNGVHEDHDMMVQYEALSVTTPADDVFSASASEYTGQSF
jgi:FtsP/CotA-like multicopper oxidase with cupredoxin domain